MSNSGQLQADDDDDYDDDHDEISHTQNKLCLFCYLMQVSGNAWEKCPVSHAQQKHFHFIEFDRMETPFEKCFVRRLELHYTIQLQNYLRQRFLPNKKFKSSQ